MTIDQKTQLASVLHRNFRKVGNEVVDKTKVIVVQPAKKASDSLTGEPSFTVPSLRPDKKGVADNVKWFPEQEYYLERTGGATFIMPRYNIVGCSNGTTEATTGRNINKECFRLIHSPNGTPGAGVNSTNPCSYNGWITTDNPKTTLLVNDKAVVDLTDAEHNEIVTKKPRYEIVCKAYWKVTYGFGPLTMDISKATPVL